MRSTAWVVLLLAVVLALTARSAHAAQSGHYTDWVDPTSKRCTEAPAGPVDPLVAGTWEMPFAIGERMALQVWTIGADGTYDSRTEPTGIIAAHQGHATFARCRWQLRAADDKSGMIDAGSYRQDGPDVLLTRGATGYGTWYRRGATAPAPGAIALWPRTVPGKAALALRIARQHFADARLISVEATQAAASEQLVPGEQDAYRFTFAFYAPSEGKRVMVTSHIRPELSVLPKAPDDDHAEPIPAAFLDLPDAIWRAREHGMPELPREASLHNSTHGRERPGLAWWFAGTFEPVPAGADWAVSSSDSDAFVDRILAMAGAQHPPPPFRSFIMKQRPERFAATVSGVAAQVAIELSGGPDVSVELRLYAGRDAAEQDFARLRGDASHLFRDELLITALGAAVVDSRQVPVASTAGATGEAAACVLLILDDITPHMSRCAVLSRHLPLIAVARRVEEGQGKTPTAADRAYADRALPLLLWALHLAGADR